jgi:hypothetical protein
LERGYKSTIPAPATEPVEEHELVSNSRRRDKNRLSLTLKWSPQELQLDLKLQARSLRAPASEVLLMGFLQKRLPESVIHTPFAIPDLLNRGLYVLGIDALAASLVCKVSHFFSAVV